MVAPTGFEPAISALRGRRPGPLDYEATTSTNKLSSSTLNIPPEQSHVKLSPLTLSVKRGLPQRLHTRAFGIKFSGKRCCTSDPSYSFFGSRGRARTCTYWIQSPACYQLHYPGALQLIRMLLLARPHSTRVGHSTQ